MSKTLTVLYRFSYRRVNVDPTTLVIDPNLIPLYSRPAQHRHAEHYVYLRPAR